jgi:hypothetical protein
MYFCDYLKALEYILRVCNCDLSGNANNDTVDDLFEDLLIPPGALGHLKDNIEKASITIDAAKDMFMEVIFKDNLPFHYFTPENTWGLICAELTHDEMTKKKLLKTARRKRRQF